MEGLLGFLCVEKKSNQKHGTRLVYTGPTCYLP